MTPLRQTVQGISMLCLICNAVGPPKEKASLASSSCSSSPESARSFLLNHMPAGDRINQDTLDAGVINTTVTLAFMAVENYPWARDLPDHIFCNYVLPYANVNEARTNWRQIIWDAFATDLAS